MMRGYGMNPFDPSAYAPSAGPNGGFSPTMPTLVVIEEEPVYEAPQRTAAPPAKAPTTPSEPLTPAKSEESTAPAEGVLPGAEATVGPSETPPAEEAEPERERPEVPAIAPGSGAPTEEYVGGTELGPEAGVGVTEEKKQVWPIVVGVGASVGVLALIALAALGGRR
jgi:hypothetical protein